MYRNFFSLRIIKFNFFRITKKKISNHLQMQQYRIYYFIYLILILINLFNFYFYFNNKLNFPYYFFCKKDFFFRFLKSKMYFTGFHVMGYLLLYFASCVNPIIYVIMNKQYRQAYAGVISCSRIRATLSPHGSSAPGQNNYGQGNHQFVTVTKL